MVLTVQAWMVNYLVPGRRVAPRVPGGIFHAQCLRKGGLRLRRGGAARLPCPSSLNVPAHLSAERSQRGILRVYHVQGRDRSVGARTLRLRLLPGRPLRQPRENQVL